jgi:hypothetical protein
MGDADIEVVRKIPASSARPTQWSERRTRPYAPIPKLRLPRLEAFGPLQVKDA